MIKSVFIALYILVGLYVIFNVVQFLSVPEEKDLSSFVGADIAIQCERTQTNNNLVVTINTGVEITDFPENYFDCVYSVSVIEHIKTSTRK